MFVRVDQLLEFKQRESNTSKIHNAQTIRPEKKKFTRNKASTDTRIYKETSFDNQAQRLA